MKTTSIRKWAKSLSCLALCGGALMAADPPAQDAPRRPQPPGDGQRRDFGGQRPGGGLGGAALFSDPSLTDEQKQALREAFEPDREKTIELYRKLAQARKGLQDATFAEKADSENIRSKAVEIGNVEADLAMLRSKSIEKVRPKLSAEQIEKLKNNPMLGGGLGGMMGQGMQRPGGGDYRRPGQEGDAARRPQTPGAGKDGYRRPGGDQPEQPRRPAAPPPEEKP